MLDSDDLDIAPQQERRHGNGEAWSVYHGDALEWLQTLPLHSADSLVCDPPAGIAFMGNEWDKDKGGRGKWIAWLARILTAAYRALRPGGYGFVWALPRTSHWTATACENAGFEIRDIFTHVSGQGFSKSPGLVRPLAEHWIFIRKPGPLYDLRISECLIGTKKQVPGTKPKAENQTFGARPASAYAGESDGYNPDVGRQPSNFLLTHSPHCVRADGEMSCVEGCPVDLLGKQSGVTKSSESGYNFEKSNQDNPTHVLTNIKSGVHFGDTGTAARFYHCFEYAASDDGYLCAPGCPVRLLSEQSGERTSGKPTEGKSATTDAVYGKFAKRSLTGGGDTGTAARYFHVFDPFGYVSKASRSEKEAGCGDKNSSGNNRTRKCTGCGLTDNGKTDHSLCNGEIENLKAKSSLNHHPTVKPVALMQHLIRLITPVGGLVIDPFTGSGTTGVACMREGLRFAGSEQDAEFVDIAKARITHAAKTAQEAKP